MELEKLMKDFYDCDDKAFEKLWRMIESMVESMVRKILLEHGFNAIKEDVEDITCNVRFKVFRTKHCPDGRYDPTKGSFAGWIATIIRNETTSFIRKNKDNLRRQPTCQEGEAERFSGSERSSGCLDEETKRLIRIVIEGLGEPFKTIAHLYSGGFTQQEIAEYLGVSVATVNRCIKQIREALDGIILKRRHSRAYL